MKSLSVVISCVMVLSGTATALAANFKVRLGHANFS